MVVPHIETPRLLLREIRESDFEFYAEICADPQFMQYVGGCKPLSRQEAWRSLATLAGHWQLKGFGFWMMEEKETGELVGRTGLLQPEGWPGLEVGWGLAPKHCGKGYATEAALASVKWGFENTDTDELISMIFPDNKPSIRVAERIGQRFSRRHSFNGLDINIYSIHRPE